MGLEGFTNMEDSGIYHRGSKVTRCWLIWAILVTIICIGLTIGIIVIQRTDTTTAPVTPIRWCTINQDEFLKCQDMAETFMASGFSPQVLCILEASVDACVNQIKSDSSVAITLDGGHLYNYRDSVQPVLAEDYGNGDATYWAVAVVKKSDPTTSFSRDDLHNKKSCHTGYGKTAGWIMPIGKMKEMGIIVTGSTCDIDTAASNVFASMCVPGTSNTDLTTLCPTCTTCQDSCLFCGYTGAFRCMVSGGGDVAFVKHTTVFDNTDGNNQDSWAMGLSSSDFELLCEDGTRNPVTNYETCNLGKVPSHAVAISKDADIEFERRIEELLFVAQLRYGQGTNNSFQMFDGASADLLFKSSTQFLQPLTETCSTQEFLGEAFLNANLAINCLDTQEIQDSTKNSCLRPNLQTNNNEQNILRWCVISDAEHQKCRQMAATAQNMAEVLTITCVQAPTTTECGRYISVGSADVVSMDGGEIYEAGVAYNLQPVTAENYDDEAADPKSYYATSVIKASDTDTAFTQAGLQGKKSCHTGYKRTSGWNVPVGLMVEEGFISVDANNCDNSVLEGVANFFGGSCVPGVPTTSQGVDQKLCQLCAGSGADKCSSNDPYSGYSGAFDCLKSGGGDVAFVKHSTLNTTVGSEDYVNYRLLCKDGSNTTVDKYADCNLEKVPSHALMMSATHSLSFRTKVVNLLKNLQKDPTFDLFESTGGTDLLFKDSTKCLSEIDPTCTWEDFLSSDYIDIIQGTRCNLAPSRATKPCLYTACNPQ